MPLNTTVTALYRPTFKAKISTLENVKTTDIQGVMEKL